MGDAELADCFVAIFAAFVLGGSEETAAKETHPSSRGAGWRKRPAPYAMEEELNSYYIAPGRFRGGDMLEKLMPRSDEFFDDFEKQCAATLEGARLFEALLKDYRDVEAKVRQIKDAEHK